MKPVKAKLIAIILPVFINHGFFIPSGSVQYTTTKPLLLYSLLRRRRPGANQRATAGLLCREPTTFRSRRQLHSSIAFTFGWLGIPEEEVCH
ncbi:hypothetical protein HanRHA438_Chr17g0799621 [Helianthus annuus]|uniref:Uncharacterized protein n=1 Tax=Helianthus annuus TaxID=4232 RepID=A0A251RRN5_HELAN|nr:hypothetical protein HanXRQr2_Chr17g0789021 [Helianthus annuus]KAJ0428191.1 hypothetical protein HanHA300_Chr17g0643391 [Helianthus annuus]KAJ0432207.1 hypothetical protein HanIR_Chr17g0856721 [Helianthus annuus]KAJ0446504.1 hypothetical protein HanHA89_Chr17g0694981 [Helianthus annuus]KAJ0631424.1 hypothetical protein HanLR1_Chr17g0653831 [Helianthus annuus]